MSWSVVIVVALRVAAAEAVPDEAVPAGVECVVAVPRIAGLARATLNSRCGAKDGKVYDGDNIAIAARGHLQLEATLEGGAGLQVTCVGAGTALVATVAGREPPWLQLPDDVTCGAWTQNERVCTSVAGDELLVCDARARLERASSLAPRPLGIPTWYVGEAAEPPATDVDTIDTTTTPAVLRIAVYGLTQSGLEDRVAQVATASVTSELRKLSGASVIGMDEVRAMLDLEAQKQLIGCDDESCLAEISAALGVDVVVTGGLAAVGGEHFFTLKRIQQKDATVGGQVSEHLTPGNGEEFLGVVGPAVAALFPELPLKPGRVRGVSPELLVRLNPPPLPPWVFWTGVGVTGVGVVGTGVATLALAGRYQEFDRVRNEEKAAGTVVLPLQREVIGWSIGSAVGGGVTVVLALTTLASAGFVDWVDAGGDITVSAQ
ncbi:MAG: hypothetical protein Q8O67_19505 [Deltaproteobacteria bacterium]|nr:hypothetical protein [Deltaproteobacteria bacterium]